MHYNSKRENIKLLILKASYGKIVSTNTTKYLKASKKVAREAHLIINTYQENCQLPSLSFNARIKLPIFIDL